MKWSIISVLVVVFSFVYFFKRSHNNVCKTFEDYYRDPDSNPNCYHNPEVDLKVPEIIERRGYVVKTYHVTTKDGYILTLFRIPHGKKSTKDKPRQPIFIQHGYGMNSAGFVNIGKKSLAFLLVDAGYDVWLGNYRGTMYSRNHTLLSDSNSKFWDFSMDELGLYDIPANLDFIYETTKQKIIYIGFSMGTISAYMYGVSYPDVAYEKVKIIISLSPAVYMNQAKLFFKRFYWMWVYVEPFVQLISGGEINVRGAPDSLLRRFLCFPFPFQMNICQIPDMMFWGFDYEQNDPETLPITMIQNSDSSSVRVSNHIIQFSLKGEFEYYDFGSKRNKEKYGTVESPKYDISKLKVPTYLFCGKNDFLVSQEDVERLHASLPKDVNPYQIHVIEYDKFNHGDFVVAKDIVPLVYDHIVSLIRGL